MLFTIVRVKPVGISPNSKLQILIKKIILIDFLCSQTTLRATYKEPFIELPSFNTDN